MTPVPGHPALNTPEGRFNTAHASTRSAVERCIGVMKSRFRCLQRHRALHYGPRKAGSIVAACAALHNLCIHEGEPYPSHLYHHHDDDGNDDDSNDDDGNDDDGDDADADNDGDDDGDHSLGSTGTTTQTAAPQRRRALFLRGRSVRARQIAMLSVARSRPLQHILRAVWQARRLQH